MDLFDFFFPEQAQASHLRSIARSQRRQVSSRSASLQTEEQISLLQQDVKFLTLVVASIIKRLGETQTLSMDDLQDLFSEIDALDGVPDGGLEPGVLRGLMGLLRKEEQTEQESHGEEFQINTTPRQRYRS